MQPAARVKGGPGDAREITRERQRHIFRSPIRAWRSEPETTEGREASAGVRCVASSAQSARRDGTISPARLMSGTSAGSDKCLALRTAGTIITHAD